jgi:hypothetical protein
MADVRGRGVVRAYVIRAVESGARVRLFAVHASRTTIALAAGNNRARMWAGETERFDRTVGSDGNVSTPLRRSCRVVRCRPPLSATSAILIDHVLIAHLDAGATL